jgi:hypothetical protein
MTNTSSRPWNSGRLALIALPFSILCGCAPAGDIAPFATNAVPAGNASARGDIYFRLHAEMRAAATAIVLPGRYMTEGAEMRPVSSCAGRATTTVLRTKSVPYGLRSRSTEIAEAVGPTLFTRIP